MLVVGTSLVRITPTILVSSVVGLVVDSSFVLMDAPPVMDVAESATNEEKMFACIALVDSASRLSAVVVPLDKLIPWM